jgi:hypothetical protein
LAHGAKAAQEIGVDNQNLMFALAVSALALAAVGLIAVALYVVLRRMRAARIAADGQFTRARLDALAVWEGEGGGAQREPER